MISLKLKEKQIKKHKTRRTVKEARDKLEAKRKADKEAQDKKDREDKEACDKLEAKRKADKEAQDKKDREDKEACDKLEATRKADKEAKDKKDHEDKEAREKLEAKCECDENTETEIKTEKGINLQNLLYEFDAEGLPIWAEKQLPKEKLTKKPPGWDQDKWENELNRRFNNIRKNAFDKLYKSCKRKSECHLQQEEAERIRKEEEERHAEERRKADRQRRAEEMEKEADQMLQDKFELSWKESGIDISKDEENGDVIPEEDQESRADEKSLENGSKGIKSESGNEVPMETEVNKNGDDGADDEDINDTPTSTPCITISLGTNADEDSASSTLSCGASGQTPTCKSMHLQSKNIALKLSQRSQVSTMTVQILSNLSLISALEVFQGAKFRTQDDMELLKISVFSRLSENFTEYLILMLPIKCLPDFLQRLPHFLQHFPHCLQRLPYCLQLPLKKNLMKKLCRILSKRRGQNMEQNVN